MYKLVAVLCTLNSVVVCNSLITKDYEQPAAVGKDAPQDAKRYGFGISKKYGYNKMIVTTYHAPVPEETAGSYSNYVIHPVDKENGAFKKQEAKANLAENPIVIEDTAETRNYLKMFPIVVEENEEEELQEEPRNEYKGYREMARQEDGDSYESWFAMEEPKAKNVLDEEVQDLYLAWFEKEGPKTTASEGYWKSFKNNFDTFYEDEFKQFFGDDGESDRFTKEGESDKKEEEFDWFPDIPYKYEYEDKSEGDSDRKNDKWDYFAYEPKYDFKRNYHFDDNNYGYRWWDEW